MRTCIIRFVFWTLIIGAICGLLVLFCPIHDALSIGGDDGFELSKSLFLARSPEAARLIWNDQPWLHTMMTAALFKAIGENAAVPRLFNLFSFIAMLFALSHLLRRLEGLLGIILMAVFLISAEAMPHLSLSAMLEVPAIGWGIVAIAIAYSDRSPVQPWRFVLSGVVLAAATHIKLTALIVLPAFALLLFSAYGWKQGLMGIIVGAAGFAAAFGFIAAISPTFSLEQLWLSHRQASGGLTEAERAELAFRLGYLLVNPGLVLAAALGVAQTLARRGPPPLLFALALLATAIGIACLQRPWWKYYLLHFHVPMAMLAGIGASQLIRQALAGIKLARSEKPCLASHEPSLRSGELGFAADVCGTCQSAATPQKFIVPGHAKKGKEAFKEQTQPYRLSRGNHRHSFCAVAAAAVCSLWFGFCLPRFLSDLAALHVASRSQSDSIVQAMKRYAPDSRWCFTRANEYAFHAKILIPPELLVLPLKRFVSGNINEERIVGVVMKYQPEQLLLKKRGELTNAVWLNWVTNHYVLVEQDMVKELWVTRSFKPEAQENYDPRLAKFGL
jgi:hypothetical protein